jgi:hypothetical protein
MLFYPAIIGLSVLLKVANIAWSNTGAIWSHVTGSWYYVQFKIKICPEMYIVNNWKQNGSNKW